MIHLKTLNLTELSDEELDSYTIEDIHDFAKESIKLYKHLKVELIKRLENGKPFKDAPIGTTNPKAYAFLKAKLLKLAQLFEENELRYRLKKEKWERILEEHEPWTDKDIIDLQGITQHIEYCSYNSKLTRQRLEILEIIRKENQEFFIQN